MHAHFLYFVKTLIKSSLDNYILPGTLTGSEILWLYVSQWKRDVTSVVFASYFLSSYNLRSKNLSAFFSAKGLEDHEAQTPVEHHLS